MTGGPAITVVGDNTTPYRGDSGGPLLSTKGEQVGVPSADVTKDYLTSYGSVARDLDRIEAQAGL